MLITLDMLVPPCNERERGRETVYSSYMTKMTSSSPYFAVKSRIKFPSLKEPDKCIC